MPSPYQPRRALFTAAPASAVSAVVAAAAVAGCDPCAGVASCDQAPRLGVSGQIVDRGNPTDADREALSGAGIPPLRPARGVRVEVTGVGGGELDAPSAASTTDASGWWQVSLPARAEGPVVVDVSVRPPGGTPYQVRGLELRASRARGDGTVLGRWTREPFLTQVGEIYDAATGAPVEGALVTAVRRGGVAVEPTANTRVPMVTVGGGRFVYDVRPLGDGVLLLDFTVERPGLPAAIVRDVLVSTQYEWLPPNVNGTLIFRLDSAGRRVGG